MKEFFRDYSYYSLKMFINQFGIALLGLTLSMVFFRAKSPVGQLVSSICAVIFYLFLIYYMTWQVGNDDYRAIKRGEKQPRPLMGLWMSLLANTPNIIFAILFPVGGAGFANIFEGMYAGILMTSYRTEIVDGVAVGVPIGELWWVYFLIIVPTLLVSTVSYYLGSKDIYFTPLFHPVNPEQMEIKKDKKENKK